ncbi:MAG: ATP-binding protein [Myxococcota bacterium]
MDIDVICIQERIDRWFLTESLRRNPEDYRKALLAAYVVLGTCTATALYGAPLLLLGDYSTVVIPMSTAILIAAGLLALRLTGSLALCRNLILALGFSSIIGVAAVTGGIRSPALYWLAAFPLLAIAIGDRKSGLVWLSGSIIGSGGFASLSALGVPVPVRTEIAATEALSVVPLIGFTTAITGIALMLETSRMRIFADLRARNRELSAAREIAEDANHAKSLLLANVSHELRTPLTAILGFSDLLAQTSSEAARKNHLETISQNGLHLLRLIDDLLDVSSIEMNQLSIEKAPHSLRVLVDEAVSSIRAHAEVKGLSVELDYATGIPDRVETDENRFRQILMNLLTNAVRFTDSGLIQIKVSGPAPDEDESTYRLVVSDSGIGMTEDQVRNAFTPFYQGDASDTRSVAGTGLGLTISRRLAGLLGGDIQIQSRRNQGTTATWTFPADLLATSVEREETPFRPSISGEPLAFSEIQIAGRILIADDNPTTRLLVRKWLERAGSEVEEACNGAEAYRIARESSTHGRPFEAILMDLQMPGLDGVEVTRRLRMESYSQPIVALTARAMSSDRDICERVGFDGFETKPIDRFSLLSKIASLTGTPSTKALPAQNPVG